MDEDILVWGFGRLYGPLYHRVERRYGKIAALVMSIALAMAIIITIPTILIATLNRL
jgi:hypothetical protein